MQQWHYLVTTTFHNALLKGSIYRHMSMVIRLGKMIHQKFHDLVLIIVV